VKRLAFSAVLLTACSQAPVLNSTADIRYWDCVSWDGGGDVHRIPITDFAPLSFRCGERICYGRGPGRVQAGQCFYGCPDERLPEYCK